MGVIFLPYSWSPRSWTVFSWDDQVHTWEPPFQGACHRTGRDPFCSTPPSLSLAAQPFYRTIQLYILNSYIVMDDIL